MTAVLEFIDVKSIKPDPDNPRKTFDKQAESDLLASVKQHGVQTPLRLRKNGDGGYVIVAGERRWRAAKAAKLAQVPAIIGEEDTARVSALIENLVREDLNPIEEGDAYAALVAEGAAPAAIAKLVSRRLERVEDRLALAGLPQPARVAIVDGRAQLRDVRPLAALQQQAPAMAEMFAVAMDSTESGWGSYGNSLWRLLYSLDRIDPSVRVEKCDACDGNGWLEDGDDEVQCEKCAGEGVLVTKIEDAAPLPTFFSWPVGHHGAIPAFDSMVEQLTEDARDRVKAAIEKARKHYDEKSKKNTAYYASPPTPIIDGDLADVANAAGVVIRIDHGRVVTDPLWVSEFLPESYEKAVESYVSGKKTKAAGSGKGQESIGGDAPPDPEKEKRAAEREAAKKSRAAGREFNGALGIVIIQELGEVPVTVEAVKLMAGTIIDTSESKGYSGTNGEGHALFQRFTGLYEFESSKAGDLKVPRSATDRADFVKKVYAKTRKDLAAAKTPEQAFGVLCRFLAHGLADLRGLPNADLDRMSPYRVEQAGWRKFLVAKLPPAFRKRIPAANGIEGRSYSWGGK